MSDEAELKIVIRGAVLATIVISMAMLAGCYITNYAPLRNGLCQGTVPGASGWVWVKCQPAESPTR